QAGRQGGCDGRREYVRDRSQIEGWARSGNLFVSVSGGCVHVRGVQRAAGSEGGIKSFCARSPNYFRNIFLGQLPLRTTGVLTERPGLTSRSGFLHAAAAAKRHKNAAQGASPG